MVDQMYRGDFATITDAIAAADPGSRILVRSGVYDEGLVIDKPLEIVGEGKLGDVIIRATGKSAIFFKTARGKISNIMIRQNGGDNCCGVDIAQGCLELEGCDISSDGGSCVRVHGNAYPKILRNKIHDGESSGVYVYENGQGVIDDSEIYCNEMNGILIIDGGNPTVRRNIIHDNKLYGIHVKNNGSGFIEYNDIYGNNYSGVGIISGGNPSVRNNRINKNAYWAISIWNKGAGKIEDNDLRDNASGAWDISEDSKALVKRARNLEK
jgi:F-box protein 11